MIRNIFLFFLFFTFACTAQQKDSLKVLQIRAEVPEKHKLVHFGLKAKVKTMKYFYGENENDFLYYEFDVNGNLLQIKEGLKPNSKSFTYDENGKLKSYKFGKRIIEIELDSSDNIIKQIIHHQERDTKTIVNEYNKDGFWLSQKVVEDNQLMLEQEYDKNNKLIKIKSFTNGLLANEISLSYVFYSRFIQIGHKSKALESGNLSQNYFYLDYFGNEISGFNPEEQNPSQEIINAVFSAFILDSNNNWIEGKTDYNTILHRELMYY